MGIKTYNPYTPSRRQMTGSDFSEITKTTPEKSLLDSKKRKAGRNSQGKITVRHRGARRSLPETASESPVRSHMTVPVSTL